CCPPPPVSTSPPMLSPNSLPGSRRSIPTSSARSPGGDRQSVSSLLLRWRNRGGIRNYLRTFENEPNGENSNDLNGSQACRKSHSYSSRFRLRHIPVFQHCLSTSSTSWPGLSRLVPAIHVSLCRRSEDVDARDKRREARA